ncbi:hypothetical protein ACN3XK_47160 [Actinomadura welshii]
MTGSGHPGTAVSPRLAGMVMGALVVGLACGGFWMWRSSERFRSAAEGTGGTPGAFVAAELREAGGMTQRPVCRGAFRPDGPGRERRGVQVRGLVESECVRGRTFRVRMAGGVAVVPGSDDWKGERTAALVLWLFVPVACVTGGLAVTVARRGRASDGSP